MAGSVSALGLGCLAAGAVLTYAGIRGYSVPQILQAVITGKDPAQLSQAFPIAQAAGGSGSGGGGVSGGTSQIASIALASVGHAYHFGGAPGTSFQDPWDCSSAFNTWSTEAGLPIPKFPPFNHGASHGPPTGVWLTWTGMRGIPRAQVQAGDALIWETHMGVAISNTEMVSALNERLSTRKTTIEDAAPPGEILFPRRWR